MQIHDGDHDSDEDFLVAMTPKPGSGAVNRIFTTGTKGSTMKRKGRQTFQMPLHELDVGLPSLLSLSTASMSELMPDGTDSLSQGEGEEQSHTLNPQQDKYREEEVDVDYFQEAPSMTLRDILLRAGDNVHMDLLGKYLNLCNTTSY